MCIRDRGLTEVALKEKFNNDEDSGLQEKWRPRRAPTLEACVARRAAHNLCFVEWQTTRYKQPTTVTSQEHGPMSPCIPNIRSESAGDATSYVRRTICVAATAPSERRTHLSCSGMIGTDTSPLRHPSEMLLPCRCMVK